MAFDNQVFINCPFDNAYKPILKSIVFCLLYLDYNPVLSENINAAQSRISGIQELIEESKFSIHDISRMKSSAKDEIARFNMPFELGLDFGCKCFGNSHLQTKCLLILDEERYRYQRALSDISGNDIEAHENKAEIALRKVRNWLQRIEQSRMDSANKIWIIYNEFMGDFYENIAQEESLSKADIEEMPWNEFFRWISEWLTAKRED